MKTTKRAVFAALALALACAMAMNLTGCSFSAQAADLMEGVNARGIKSRETDESFMASTADFSVRLFRETVTKGKSSLVSPLSVMLALAMTANGADDSTKAEMETLLGGEIPLADLNEYLHSYVGGLPSDKKYKLKTANSIWFRDTEELWVENDFLQKNADYYAASAYKAPFDGGTVKNINNWVRDKTDGMIKKVIEEIDSDSMMFLINALVFDAEWAQVYEKNQVTRGIFHSDEGKEQEAQMMFSTEGLYIDYGGATGFIKPYKDGKYAFVALLPEAGVSLEDYIGTLTGENFRAAVNNAETAPVAAQMPKFSYDYTIIMNDALIKLGMPSAFDAGTANFSRLGRFPGGNLFIGEVLHKTFISVAERGTKAGAVTVVDMRAGSMMPGYAVVLNRPFVYAIIDTSAGLPLFMGTVTEISE